MRTLYATLGFVFVGTLFLCSAYLAREYDVILAEYDTLTGYWGMAQYVALSAVAVVVAPVSTLPLLPLASALWGPLVAAVLSILGWLIGAQVAYELARGVARPLIMRVVNIRRAERYALLILGRRPFITLTLLRMCLPVEVLSYAVGLFVPMNRRVYIAATAIGIAPFAFVFAYASEFSLVYQLGALGLAGGAVIVGMLYTNRPRQMCSG